MYVHMCVRLMKTASHCCSDQYNANSKTCAVCVRMYYYEMGVEQSK